MMLRPAPHYAQFAWGLARASRYPGHKDLRQFVHLCRRSRNRRRPRCSGARFRTGGEALTPGKAGAIRRTGAESYAAYNLSELGTAGAGCPHYEGQNTLQ